MIGNYQLPVTVRKYTFPSRIQYNIITAVVYAPLIEIYHNGAGERSENHIMWST